MTTITLPFPPSANRYWRFNRGIIHRSTEAKEYIKQAGWIAKSHKLECLGGDIAVTLEFYRPAKRGDLDNSLKVCLDSLRGIAYADDKQIVRIVANRYDDKQNPRVLVTIHSAWNHN